jgi:hypothetical protein
MQIFHAKPRRKRKDAKENIPSAPQAPSILAGAPRSLRALPSSFAASREILDGIDARARLGVK